MKPWERVTKEFRNEAAKDPHPLDAREFVAGDKLTNYAEARMAAADIAEKRWQTGVEKGLAVTLAAVIADFESYVQEHGDETP